MSSGLDSVASFSLYRGHVTPGTQHVRVIKNPVLNVCSKATLAVQGEPVFMNVWAVGLCLMSAHLLVYWALVSAHSNSKRNNANKDATRSKMQ